MAGRQPRLGWRSCRELGYHVAVARRQARMHLKGSSLLAVIRENLKVNTQ